jgi:hypothetical protein
VGFPLVWCAGGADKEAASERCESQKLQTRTPDRSIAPHCKHVLFTGKFLRCGRFHSGEERIRMQNSTGEKANEEN